MRMSAQGRKLLKQREGVRLKAYYDSVGVLTIGVGHTSAAGPPHVTPGMVITEAQADEILTADLRAFERIINDAVLVSVSQNEYDALVSICFNVGPRFATSTCIKRLNARDRMGAAEAILMWNKPPEIRGRRRSEYIQFLTPYSGLKLPPDAPAAPVPEVKNSTGKSHVGKVAGGAIATGAAIEAAHTQGVSHLTIALVCVGIVAAGVLGYFIWKRFR